MNVRRLIQMQLINTNEPRDRANTAVTGPSETRYRNNVESAKPDAGGHCRKVSALAPEMNIHARRSDGFRAITIWLP